MSWQSCSLTGLALVQHYYEARMNWKKLVNIAWKIKNLFSISLFVIRSKKKKKHKRVGKKIQKELLLGRWIVRSIVVCWFSSRRDCLSLSLSEWSPCSCSSMAILMEENRDESLLWRALWTSSFPLGLSESGFSDLQIINSLSWMPLCAEVLFIVSLGMFLWVVQNQHAGLSVGWPSLTSVATV